MYQDSTFFYIENNLLFQPLYNAWSNILGAEKFFQVYHGPLLFCSNAFGINRKDHFNSMHNKNGLNRIGRAHYSLGCLGLGKLYVRGNAVKGY